MEPTPTPVRYILTTVTFEGLGEYQLAYCITCAASRVRRQSLHTVDLREWIDQHLLAHTPDETPSSQVPS